MEYTVELYEDPDQWSFWEVIEWGNPDHRAPGERPTKTGRVLHRVRGNDRFAELAAREWLLNYNQEIR
jgi:hypothetical protein